MNIDQWLVTYLQNSSASSYTTNIRPEFLPQNSKPPAIIYRSIGFDRNRKNKMNVMSLTCLHNSLAEVELLNDCIYNIFDTSTHYIRESSSDMNIESVTILNNNAKGFDEENKYWYHTIDIRYWYHNT